MAFITKEEFEAIVKNKYDNLTKQDFAELMGRCRIKIRELVESKDVLFEKTDDDYELKYASSDYYKTMCEIYGTVSSTKRLSFKQFKSLSAFIKAHISKDDTEYKQF